MSASCMEMLLAPGAVRMVFQPIFDVQGGGRRIHAYEALARGPASTHFESPSVLFDYARRKRCEHLLDLLCVREALRAGAPALETGALISVNLHASTLSREGSVVDEILALTDRFGVPPRQLIVEIVEHSPAWNTASLLESLSTLRAAGVRIALDDLGLGESNLRMLLDCRPDYLKLDRYLVAGCHRDGYRRALLRSLAGFAVTVCAEVVAEGVEQPEELEAVVSLGIRLIQGFLLQSPGPIGPTPLEVVHG